MPSISGEPSLVAERANDEHGRANPHEGAAPHPVFPSDHLVRLDDGGPVDYRRLVEGLLEPIVEPTRRELLVSDRLEELVVLLDRDLDHPITGRLDLAAGGNF